MTKYKIIYADPPWQYSNTFTRANAESNYPTMNINNICNLEIEGFLIKEIIEENAILFLWTTGPFLQESFKIIEAWGFKYKTLGFGWTKLNQDKSLFMGLGNYTRSNFEICLIGTKGNLKIEDHNVKNVIISKRLLHSEKPQIIRDLIDKMFPTGNRIELFARKKAISYKLFGTPNLHWDLFGDEVNRH